MTDWAAIAKQARSLLDQDGLSVAVTIGETSYQGVRTTLRRQDVNSDAGLIEGRYVFSVLLDASAVSEPPPRRTLVTVGDVRYRVLSCETDAIGACIRLNLGDVLA